MTSYEIIEVDEVENVVTVHVTFDALTAAEERRNPDGAPAGVYVKRMTAPVPDGADAVGAAIDAWLAEYEPQRAPASEKVNEVKALIGREFAVGEIREAAALAVAEEAADIRVR